MTAIETTGSDLIAALEQTWVDLRRRVPELPEVVIVTGTGLSAGAFHVDDPAGLTGSVACGPASWPRLVASSACRTRRGW